MRPHALRFAGIGPFPQPVEINFDELATLDLYLIVGPTGAGKTTIFDALTFALYGEVAGSRQKAIKGFVSDHPFDREAYVELEFSHRGNRYRVRRRPPSDKFTTRPNDHRIVALDEHGGEGEAVTGTRDVTARVEALLGLEADQFKRVVLIPQNEFQDFLVASDTDKEKILTRLFDTALYRRTAEHLFRIGREIEGEAAQAEQAVEVQQGIAATTIGGLVADGLLDLPAPEEPLVATLARLTGLAAAAHAAREAADKQLQAATQALGTGETEARRFDAAARLAVLTATHEQAAEAVTGARAALALHEKALTAAPPAATAATAAGRVTELEGVATLTRERLAAMLTAHAGALPLLQPLADLGGDATPSALAAEATRLLNAVEAAARLHGEAAAEQLLIADATEAAEAALQAIGEANKTIGQLDNERKLHQQETARLFKLVGGLGVAQHDVTELDRLLGEADVEGTRATVASAETALTTATAALGEVVVRLAAARASVDAEHAGRLASQLADGEPCPVCGGLDHPRLAEQTVATAALDEIDTERTQSLARQAAAQEALTTAVAAQTRAGESAAQLPAPERQAELRAALEAAEAAQAALTDRSEHEDTLAARRTETDDHLTQAVGTRAAAAQKIETLAPISAGKSAQASAIVPAAQSAAAMTVLGTLVAAIEALSTATGQLDGAREARERTTAALAAVLVSAGFETLAAARAALLDEGSASRLTEAVEAATARASALDELRGAVGTEPVPPSRPDTTTLEHAVAEARRHQQAAVGRSTALTQAARALSDIADALSERGPAAAELRRLATEALDLARIVKDGNATHLALERWVLRSFFEEVCAVATTRLAELSRGRYELTLDGPASGRRGLAIFVFDAYTGKTRAVELLSGGEKFLASLALALGLAEVVQSQSGGIDLSTMFIDEGFGSLDQETLDVAVDVLRDLLDSGRTVGVITHVEAMKQELPVGLEVVRGTRGSSVRTGAALA